MGGRAGHDHEKMGRLARPFTAAAAADPRPNMTSCRRSAGVRWSCELHHESTHSPWTWWVRRAKRRILFSLSATGLEVEPWVPEKPPPAGPFGARTRAGPSVKVVVTDIDSHPRTSPQPSWRTRRAPPRFAAVDCDARSMSGAFAHRLNATVPHSTTPSSLLVIGPRLADASDVVVCIAFPFIARVPAIGWSAQTEVGDRRRPVPAHAPRAPVLQCRTAAKRSEIRSPETSA